jgi:hypothetical protein
MACAEMTSELTIMACPYTFHSVKTIQCNTNDYGGSIPVYLVCVE